MIHTSVALLAAAPGSADASPAGASPVAAASIDSGSATAASAQIAIGSIICLILNSLAASFSNVGFLVNIINALLAAFGCPTPSPG